jgi:protein SCO1/2
VSRHAFGAAVLAAAAVALLAGCGGGDKTAAAPTTTAAPHGGHAVLADATAEDFALHDQNGRLVRLSAQRGHIVLLTFLYTSCRDVCPLIADHLKAATAAVGAAGRDVRILAVSVDPAGDTPSAVRRFIRVHRLGSGFSYLTGTRTELQPVWQAYNVLAMRRNDEVVDHSAPTLLLDARGRPRIYYESNFSSTAVTHDLRRLLRG